MTELQKRTEAVADRLNGFHDKCCEQCTENYKNSMADAKLISELSAKLREMDELNPVTLVCKNDDGSTYEVRRFQFETEFNQIKEEMIAEGRFDNLHPTPPKKES